MSSAPRSWAGRAAAAAAGLGVALAGLGGAPAQADPDDAGTRTTVMTRNLYLGVNIQRPIAATLGKTAGKDVDANKPTYVTVLGLQQARRRAQELHAQAQAALRASALDDTVALAMLADKVVDRDS